MIKIISLLSFLMLIFSQPNLLSAAMTSNNYQIWQDAISVGGGEDQSSANYGLQDTLGELAVDPSSSTNNALKPGFRSNQFFSGQQTLTFSVSPATLEFGKLDKSSTAMGSVVLSVETNSYTGVSVTYGGNTLTCGACTSNPKEVSAIGSGASAANAGSSQFGFNAIYSSGSSPVASALSPYNTEGLYAFQSGDQIISSSGQINATTFNINFIANISGDEKGGTYTAAITYTATANF
ncbi:MAG: hypothetical protein A3B89_04975 [Candidatus Buchananbacteria bacterium RIFCSPHIGHO2_02_FULL_40_13]|uniref:WxL domain-containing protein n=1 Tax=Candidatus Buchananbacteria bacterium RIFCSPLOWO2_01_FULL_39_33 TaxID=1797543 RepID=A0A1G1YGE1_9BACT|nr:MAG: hypothetical protein A2820_00300 [Candidatus Buchananbacteria bacterium RIFCSPHIGHO2_01_FULL_40_35]OGY49794.1 MAG: hypothetical protein A3B89_04975 [Candidatus Buchananbacteria bacterium RIFCSPHIGHO2_02_FULL_40_13]OGY51415.1 MAG: hypothetical protein A3A02_03520 [Candidatus Buchananbacteria bacterium RIFCSPLOWO2_01_FULL_39_33]